MRKINFLINLMKEGKLKLAEPSESVKEAYINKSKNSLRSSIILLSNKQIEDAVPMAYYSMYNILTALFYKIGIKCENHSASIIILRELFKLDDSKITFAKTERVDKQYYVDFKVTEKEVNDLINLAKEFNNMLYSFIDRITTKEISKYREEIIKMLKRKT